MILEHYINLKTDEDKKQYIDEIWEILQRTYKDIGGIADGTQKEDLLNDNIFIKAVRKHNNIIAVCLYKLKDGGRKLYLGGQDGTREGKEAFYKILSEDITQSERNAWAEISGGMEKAYILKLKGKPIPVNDAEKILNKFEKQIIEKDVDGFHYTRLINGKPFQKIMVGNLPKEYTKGD